MSKSLTYEISDELFEAFRQMAGKTGSSPEALALEWLARRTAIKSRQLSEEEKRVGLQQLMRHSGAVDSGDPRSADNERIDADLAREYTLTHDE